MNTDQLRAALIAFGYKDPTEIERVIKQTIQTTARPGENSMRDLTAFAAAKAAHDAVAPFYNIPPATGPLDGETYGGFVARLAAPYQKHSPTYRSVNLLKIASEPVAVELAASHIYRDAARHAKCCDPGTPLREVKTRDAQGRNVSEFYGDPMHFIKQFSGGVRYVTAINKHPGA